MASPSPKQDQERPTAAEGSEAIGEPFSEGAGLVIVFLGIGRHHGPFGKASRDLLVELGQLAAFLAEKLLHMQRPVTIGRRAADPGVSGQRRVILTDPIRQGGMQMIE